jgi:hypothetical protein
MVIGYRREALKKKQNGFEIILVWINLSAEGFGGKRALCP